MKCKACKAMMRVVFRSKALELTSYKCDTCGKTKTV